AEETGADSRAATASADVELRARARAAPRPVTLAGNPRHNLFMRLTLALVACLAPVCAAASTATVSPTDYKARRAELRKSLDGVMILFGADEPEEDLHNAFFQESNFLYLTGWREPGAVMLLTPMEEVLFLPPRDAQAENFSGRKTLPEDRDVAVKTGF